MHAIEFTPEAIGDLKSLRKREQQEVLDGIDDRLNHEPMVETRNRKKLSPNEVAEWELRLGRFRIFYNVDQEAPVVRIEAIGFKVGNLLFIRGKKVDL